MAKNTLALVIVVFFSFIATVPLFHPGLPPTHDGEYHIIRFYEFYKTLSSGVIYPRWADDLNNGYGAPLFNFVYPLPNYIAALFHSFGISFIDSFKYNFVAATVFAAIGFYFFAKYFAGIFGGIVGAIIYIFNPYRFVDTYVRGSVGEVWSLAVLPLLLWSFAILIKEQKYRYIVLCTFFTGLLIFSHNILTVLFFPFFFSYIVFLICQTKNKIKSIIACLTSLVLGIGITAIFWIPALLEKEYVRGLEIFDYKTFFPDLISLLFPSWGTGFASGAADSMSTQIGVVNLLVVIISLFYLIKHVKNRDYLMPFSFIWFILTVLLMLPYSSSIWSYIPLFHFVQFPWRYLSLIIVLCSILAAQVVAITKYKKILAIILVGLAVMTTINYTNPAYYHLRDDNYYIKRENFIHGTNSPGNAFNTIWIDKPLPTYNNKAQLSSGTGLISQIIVLPEHYQFNVTALTPVSIRLNTAYFPGWKAYSSEKNIEIKRTSFGQMEIVLPKGNHFIRVMFVDTIVRRTSKLISLLSLVMAVGIGIYFAFRSEKNENRY